MASTNTLNIQAIERICCGNREAIEWLNIGLSYIHAIDDLIDEDIATANRRRGAERVCTIGAYALELYTHPFFVKNSQALATVMLVNTNMYADSVAWENTETEWQKVFSDWARHGWLEVVLIVAYLCGGYSNMRSVAPELRTVAYADHHDQDGNKT